MELYSLNSFVFKVSIGEPVRFFSQIGALLVVIKTRRLENLSIEGMEVEGGGLSWIMGI